MPESLEPLRIAIIGCGAIAELGHLPGALASTDVAVTALVDLDLARAEALAARFGVQHVSADWNGLDGRADAAVVALPPHLHRQATEELLAQGLHVLCEKPLATTVEDAEAMIAAAKAADRVLAVAMMRRFARSARYCKAAIEAGMLGKISRYVARSGVAGAWPARSPFAFNPDQAGGGALIDNGCHDLDLLFWLLGPFRDFTFASDSPARLEANCLIEGALECGASATIEVSRSRDLSNTIRIEGEFAMIEAPLMGEAVRVFPAGASPMDFPGAAPPPLDFPRLMAAQLSDFAAAMRGKATYCAAGTAGLDMLCFIAECYRQRTGLVHPWDLPIDLGAAA